MFVNLIFIFVIAFAGSVLQNTIGFGTIIVCMAILPMFLPVQTALTISLVGGAVLSWWMLFGIWKSIDWKKILLPTIFACISIVASLFFARKLDEGIYMKLLGAMLVLLCIWMMCFAAKVHIKSNNRNGIIAGTLSGVMGALFGIGAPPLVLYYSSTTEDKDNYTACLQITLAIHTMLNIFCRIGMHLFSPDAWIYCIPIVIGVVLGKFPGKRIYNKLDIKTFKLLIHLFIGILGIYIFLSNL